MLNICIWLIVFLIVHEGGGKKKDEQDQNFLVLVFLDFEKGYWTYGVDFTIQSMI